MTALGSGWIEVTPPGKPARRVLADGTRAGGDSKGLGEADTYLVSQLAVGDIVTVFVGSDGPDEVCHLIWLHRRPGGKIPPPPWEPGPGRTSRPDLQEQAEQDWEEKGIPIPEKYLDPNGRAPWTDPPYPPVAPMPREARR